MSTKKRYLSRSELPQGFRGALKLLAYALRALRSRVSESGIGDYRYKNFADELATALHGEHRPGMGALVWFGNLCGRWNVSAAGDADHEHTITVFLPEGFSPWHEALSGIRRTHLARIVEDYGQLLATFAVSREPREAGEALEESQLFDAIDEPDEVPTPWIPQHSGEIIEPARHASVWTLTAPLAHGADEKDGNVSRFRCEARLDTLTGKWVDVPFLAGNAVRGMMRDLLMIDAMTLVGVSSQRVPGPTAHALLSGGQISSGADTAGVDLPLRRLWRGLFPAVDLLGGVIENQTMAGWLRCSDALPVARETTAHVARVIAPELDPSALAARLPCVQDLFEVRQLTRMAHREIDGDGGQMIAKTECIRAGTQFVHKVALTGQLGQAPLVVRACLVRALRLLQDNGVMGAGAARGLGEVLIGAYLPALGTEDAYLEHLQKHRAEIADLLLAPVAAKEEKPAKGKKPAAKTERKQVEPVSPGDEDVPL
jgi:hypothetical protein